MTSTTCVPTRKKSPPAPAALALAAEGYTTRDLATVLGVSAQSAAHYLSGRRGTPEALAGALRKMVGVKAADGLLELIPRG